MCVQLDISRMNEISSDRKPNSKRKKKKKIEICIKSVYRYERRKEREEKTREITSFLSILSDFQQIQVKFYQLFATVLR